MNKHTRTSQTKRLLKYLISNGPQTVGEIRDRLRIKNPSAVVDRLRTHLGELDTVYWVYTNRPSKNSTRRAARYNAGLMHGEARRWKFPPSI